MKSRRLSSTSRNPHDLSRAGVGVRVLTVLVAATLLATLVDLAASTATP